MKPFNFIAVVIGGLALASLLNRWIKAERQHSDEELREEIAAFEASPPLDLDPGMKAQLEGPLRDSREGFSDDPRVVDIVLRYDCRPRDPLWFESFTLDYGRWPNAVARFESDPEPMMKAAKRYNDSSKGRDFRQQLALLKKFPGNRKCPSFWPDN